jgi:hypothetical protein
VTAWEPPARFACTWHPGYDPSEGQDLDVTFVADGDGTRVELMHTGWERRGASAAEKFASYDSRGGWELILEGCFAKAV